MSMYKSIEIEGNDCFGFKNYHCLETEDGTVISSLYVKELSCSPLEYQNIIIDPSIKKTFYLSSFGTVEKYRKQGYARKLLRKVKEEYKGSFIILSVYSETKDFSNKDLMKFYKSEGFIELEPPKGMYPLTIQMYIEL